MNTLNTNRMHLISEIKKNEENINTYEESILSLEYKKLIEFEKKNNTEDLAKMDEESEKLIKEYYEILLSIFKKYLKVELGDEDISNYTLNYLEYYLENLEKFLNNINGFMDYVTQCIYNKEYYDKNRLEELKLIDEEYKRIIYIEKFANEKNTIILVGKNGAGKSSFINYFESSTIKNVMVLNAQKLLMFQKDESERYTISKEGYISKFKNKNNKDYNDYKVFRERYVLPYTLLVTVLLKDYLDKNSKKIELKDSCKDLEESNLKIVKEILAELIPEIKLDYDIDDITIKVSKEDSEPYDINYLSDGEKVIIYYIGNVLLAPKNSYIFVDEPETYLNPATYKKLWDILIKKRRDCQFIFSSHTIDFINSRKDPLFYWMKNFNYPNDFKIEKLETIDFPIDLLNELIGSRNKILFCEGTYSSYDYKLYSALFGDKYTVKPVGGHNQVINFTKAFNKVTNLHLNEAKGIIDGDNKDCQEIESYKKKNIHVIPFNEIEMFLLDEIIVKHILSKNYDEIKTEEKLKQFKECFFMICADHKDEIIRNIIKVRIDRILMGSMTPNPKNMDIIKNHIKKLTEDIDIEKIEKEIQGKMEKNIFEKKYSEMLNMISLKNKLLNELCNLKLVEDYPHKAIRSIEDNVTLREQIKKQYFNDI